MDKLLIITGPTATGKTAFGIEAAKRYGGEILSADSRQVYKYMDIGTGKDRSFPQWGLDLVKPGEPFSASNYVDYARKVLDDIWNRKKLPIIVGGTGLYIKELLNPSKMLHVPPNLELRNKNYEINELQDELRKVDLEKWEKMNNSDRNNPRRLVRAIEVAMTGFHPGKQGETLNASILIIGLTAPIEFIYKRIDQRVEDRIAAGIEKEREFLKKYKLPKTLGYNNETDEQWRIAEHGYAKRQLDYMGKFLPETVWFDITTNNWKDEVWQTIKSTLNI